MTEIKFSEKDLSFFKDHDFSGISGYTDTEKIEILNGFLNEVSGRLFLTRKQRNLRLTEKPSDAEDISVKNESALKVIKGNLKKAIIYLGYVEGNFKWAKYILCDEANINNEKVYVYAEMPLEQNLGKVVSSLSQDIIQAADANPTWESNLQKMMKRQGYRLRTPGKRKYLFGKGHISAPREIKVQVKRDLGIIFEIMDRSKAKAAIGEYVTDISDKVSNLNYFDFIKV